MKECKEAEARGNFEKRIKVLVKKGGRCYTVYTATDGYGDAKVSTGTVLRQTSRPFAHEYHGMGESVKKW